MTWITGFIRRLFSTTEFVVNFSIAQLDKLLAFRSLFPQDISDKIIVLKRTLEFVQFLLENLSDSFEISLYRGLLHLFLYILLGIYLYRGN